MERLRERMRKQFGKEAVVLVLDGGITNSKMAHLWKTVERRPHAVFVLLITSDGGVIEPVLNFYTMVQLMGINLVTVGTGHVYSAGVILLLAGQKRYATKGTEFMLHQTLAPLHGDFNQTHLAQEIAMLRELDKKILDILRKRLKIPKGVAQAMMQKDTYFSSKKAAQIGLIHALLT